MRINHSVSSLEPKRHGRPDGIFIPVAPSFTAAVTDVAFLISLLIAVIFCFLLSPGARLQTGFIRCLMLFLGLIIEHIRNRRIKKVVFVSGDVHCSFVSKLILDTDPEFRVHGIVSSSFFWPYPHMSRSEFAFDVSLTGVQGHKYQTTLLSNVYSDNNVARLKCSLGTVDVSFFERKGSLLGKVTTITP